MADAGEHEAQRFSATSGRVLGVLAVATSVGLVFSNLLSSDSDPSYAAIALTIAFGALAWAALVRPRVELDASRLVLRNMLTTVTVPLAAIESVTVRQLLVVRVGDKRYTSPAVGRSRRQLVREGSRASGGGGGLSSPGMMGAPGAATAVPEQPETARTSYGLFVEERIRARAADARAHEGVKARSPEQARLAEAVTRQPAFAEIAVLLGSLLAFLVLVLR